MTERVIDLEAVSWRTGRELLLDRVSWQVERGQHWALYGLNGSGKTTLLNLINGYIWPSAGAASVLGHRFGEIDLRVLRRSIGWVSASLQDKLYASDKTQHVVISGKHATIGLYDKVEQDDLARAEALMATLGCAKLWDRELRTCSQGEKQKVVIARALMAEPELLILDEPCNGLDLFARETLLAGIEGLTRQPSAPTLLYVTHHTEEILPVFGHTLLLRGGRVFDRGETQRMLEPSRLGAFFEAPVALERHDGRVYVRPGAGA
ncbi:ABC transporter ATP-binding protein [Paenibacillus sp. IB182496]|uniref:ABC transporter ATP-binding protein n=1 Tax=Paenibacillus sabuli TaxID=2772509 RepID=A0A927BS90_9BACL|nr:ABC transporter ATP-binding protein [Paenibacillus sabuli]MBD2844805.1 ABC transporter ATP-binding protein [Paenibacillus sabuli]